MGRFLEQNLNWAFIDPHKYCPFSSGTAHRIKDKNKEKESKIEANLTQVINTQSSCTSQVDGSDSDSSVFLFSVITPIVGYSGDSEWMIDTGATYHVCPNRD